MSFTLKQIDGAVVEKRDKEWVKSRRTIKPYPFSEAFGYNEAIDAQSSVKLRLNREKLKDILWEKCKYSNLETHEIYAIVEIIIAADKDIIEVKK